MERTILFNCAALDNYLEERQKNPDRTDWELTMLRDNCKRYIKNEKNEYIININELTWNVSINGQTDLQDKFYMLPTWYDIDNRTKLYRQVKQALEEAKTRWIYNQIFKEIRESE